MISKITRRIEIDAGHRIATHGGMCKGLHGHRYVIEATVFGELVTVGTESDMVTDFGTIKQAMMELIHATFDHAMILAYDDPVAEIIAGAPIGVVPRPCFSLLPSEPFFTKLTLIEHAPTAERLSELWYYRLQKAVPGIFKVTVFETPNCWASFSL